jgi:uncharacterized protein (DUF3084 family)
MIVWWFFLLGVGAIGFAVKILLDHIKDAYLITDQIQATERNIGTFEEKLNAEEAEAAELKQELEQVQQDLDTHKSKGEVLRKKLDKTKQEMARQGKFRLE